MKELDSLSKNLEKNFEKIFGDLEIDLVHPSLNNLPRLNRLLRLSHPRHRGRRSSLDHIRDLLLKFELTPRGC